MYTEADLTNQVAPVYPLLYHARPLVKPLVYKWMAGNNKMASFPMKKENHLLI